ncbi:MAG: disulfide bond formation protein B [Rhodomicrobium sp.]|nr:disulfide bond formation protein B [Rhodomicrobium sp.]
MAYRVLATTRRIAGLGFEDAGRTIAILSALALAGALAIEHIGGIAPCPLCLDQRIVYYAAIPLGVLAFMLAPGRRNWSLAVLAILAAGFVFNGGFGVYHAGIEWGWWRGPEACAGAGSLAKTPEELLKSLAQSTVVRCDEAALRIFGLSLAAYSAILSACLAGVALLGIADGRNR